MAYQLSKIGVSWACRCQVLSDHFRKLKRDTDQFDIATIKIDKTGVKVEAPQVDLKQKEEE